MSDGLNRLLGDTPGRIVVKLLILSVVVGFVMSMIGLSPWDLMRFVDNGIRELWHSGFRALGRVGDYLVVGAMIVVPIFIVLRILNWRKT